MILFDDGSIPSTISEIRLFSPSARTQKNSCWLAMDAVIRDVRRKAQDTQHQHVCIVMKGMLGSTLLACWVDCLLGWHYAMQYFLNDLAMFVLSWEGLPFGFVLDSSLIWKRVECFSARCIPSPVLSSHWHSFFQHGLLRACSQQKTSYSRTGISCASWQEWHQRYNAQPHRFKKTLRSSLNTGRNEAVFLISCNDVLTLIHGVSDVWADVQVTM